jgi:hypothetical protein
MSQDHQIKFLVLRFAGRPLNESRGIVVSGRFFRALGMRRKKNSQIGDFETWVTQPPFKAWSRPPPPLSLTSMGVRGRSTWVRRNPGMRHCSRNAIAGAVCRDPDVLRSTDEKRSRGAQCSLQLRVFRFGCFRMGMSGSASFQSVRKSWYAASARTRAASASAPCEVLAWRAFALATPRCDNAPVQQFQTMPLWSRIFWNSAAEARPCPAAKYGSPRTYTW